MATEKILNTRIQLKYDTLDNWSTEAALNFTPKKGEVCIVAIPSGKAMDGDTHRPQYLMKVGAEDSNGTLIPFKDLEWVSAKAADVYDWAKKELTTQSIAANAATNITNRTYLIQKDNNNRLVVNVPWEKGSYTLPTATSTKLGGVKLFSDTKQSVAANAVTAIANRTYGVQMNANDQLVVNVPWTAPTSFDITANAKDDDVVVLTGTSGSNSVTYEAKHAKKGPSSGYTSANATTSISGSGTTGKIKIPQLTVDEYGHVTAAADEEISITLPTVPTVPNITVSDTSTGTFVTDVSASGHTITLTRGNAPSITVTDNTTGASATTDEVDVVTDVTSAGHTLTLTRSKVASKKYVDGKVAGATQYLGTVGDLTELKELNPGRGDFARVSTAFNGYHVSDMLICESPKTTDPAADATWSVIHGELESWTPNTKDADGYVTKGSGQKNKVWKTDADGVPAWRDDADTKVTSAANHYTPAADTASALNKDAAGTTNAAWGTTSIVTGVNIARDSKGHVTGLTLDAVKMPANPNQNTAHTHEAGVGLVLADANTGGISGKVTYKAKIKSESKLTRAATAATETENRVYPVALDKDGYLAVNVPWQDTNSHHQAKLIAGASATAKSNAAVNESAKGVFLNIVENDAVRSSNKLIGIDGLATSSDASGNINIGIDENVTFVFDCGGAPGASEA